MKRFTRFILHPFKHILGIGYSTCHSCGFPWNLVEEHSIDIKNGCGCFATCEDCWNTKSDEEIIAAYNDMYDDWIFGDKYNKPLTSKEIGFTREEMLTALDKELKKRKNS